MNWPALCRRKRTSSGYGSPWMPRPARSLPFTWAIAATRVPSNYGGFVANLAQEVMKRQLLLSVEGLGSQGGEQCGRRKALPSLCDYELSLLDHGHEFDADERGRCRVKGFEP